MEKRQSGIVNLTALEKQRFWYYTRFKKKRVYLITIKEKETCSLESRLKYSEKLLIFHTLTWDEPSYFEECPTELLLNYYFFQKFKFMRREFNYIYLTLFLTCSL